MTTRDMNDDLFQQFLEFQARKLADQEKQSRKLDDDRTSDSVDREEMSQTRDSSPILFLSSDPIEPMEDQPSMTSQRLSSLEILNDEEEYHSKSPSDGESNSDTPLESIRSPTPEPTKRRYSFRSREQQAERANLAADLPASSNTRRHRSPSPQTGPSKRRRRSSPVSNDSVTSTSLHPYDTCPTSYKSGSGKRGARIRLSGKGRAGIRFTPMERLVEREAKYKHVRKHGHLFGDKHGCYFNPYSYSPINNKTFKRIVKPPGVLICRTSKPVHELMGLRDDYELRLEIGETIRHAGTLFQPKDIVLKPDECLSYAKHYSLAARIQIYKYMYIRFPFLYHFRTDSDKGNWIIDGICNSSIISRNIYLKAKRLPTDFDLKQNISDSIENGENTDELKELEIPSGYEDDYALYAGTSGASRSNKRPRPSEIDAEASDDYDVDSCSPKKRRGSLEDPLPGPSTVYPKPTTGEDLDVNQGVVRRRAHRNVFGTPGDKTGRTAIAGSAGKGDRRKHARLASTPRSTVKMEYGSEDEPVQHEDHVFSVPEFKPVLRPDDTETTTKNTESNGRNHRIDTQPAVKEPASQSPPSALRGWLSTITFGVWKW